MYIIFDTESIPDGKLLKLVKYKENDITEEKAIEEAKREALEKSGGKSEFISPAFQIPIAVSMMNVNDDYLPEKIIMLDSPNFNPKNITEKFWKIMNNYIKNTERNENYANNDNKNHNTTIVTFNGRGFDLPLMEISAFRYGVSYGDYILKTARKRYSSAHIDLMDWFTNFGVLRSGYSLDLFAKLLGKPGKMDIKGSDVYELYKEGKLKEINEYCMHDVLDTYFVFLRYLVLVGKITLEEEQDIIHKAKLWIEKQSEEISALKEYLKNWGNWNPWP